MVTSETVEEGEVKDDEAKVKKAKKKEKKVNFRD